MAPVVTKAVTAEKISSLKTYKASELSTADLLALTARPRIDFTSILHTVRYQDLLDNACLDAFPLDFTHCFSSVTFHQVAPIVDDVRRRGDAAVKGYTSRFDRVELSSVCVPIEVS